MIKKLFLTLLILLWWTIWNWIAFDILGYFYDPNPFPVGIAFSICLLTFASFFVNNFLCIGKVVRIWKCS